MSEGKNDRVLIVGGGFAGRRAIIAALMSTHTIVEIVDVGGHPIEAPANPYLIKPPIVEALKEYKLTENFYSDGKSPRNKRREDERKAKKYQSKKRK